MEKDITHRIAYYVKKVNQACIHPSKPKPRSFKYRSQRLNQYKSLLHAQIKKEGYIK